MFGEITKTDGVAAVAKAEENDAQTHDDHHDNGGHFYHGEPELDFTVQPDRREVRQRHQPHGNQRRDPLRHLREPELHIDPDGGNLRDPHRHPHKPVGPRGQIAEEGAHIAMRIHREGASDRLKEQHFAH